MIIPFKIAPIELMAIIYFKIMVNRTLTLKLNMHFEF